MAFPSAPHSAAQSSPTSSPSHQATHQVSESKNPGAETKFFSGALSSITNLFTKTKDVLITRGNSIPLESRARQPVRRDDQATQRRRYSADIFECVDEMEEEFTTIQKDAKADALDQALRKVDELRQQYSSSMKKISKLENQLKESRQENETLREQLRQRSRDHGAPTKVTHDDFAKESFAAHSVLHNGFKEQQVVENFTFDLAEKDDEIRVLKEKCESRHQRIKTLEKQTADLGQQAKHYEVVYCVEVEENQALKSEMEKLRHQLAIDALSSVEESNLEEQTITDYRKAVSALRGQLASVSDDMDKLRDHSKEQSRQILMFRQQTEMTEMMESRIESEERMRHEAEGEITTLREELRIANQRVNTLQTGREHLENELRVMKEESARCIQDQNEIIDLRKQHATLKDEYEQALKSMKAMGALSGQLAESEKSVRMLEHQLESTVLAKNELSDQLQATNAQLQMYQNDFETERKDRETAHSKLADQEKTIARLRTQIQLEDSTKVSYEEQLVQHQESMSAIEQVNEKLHEAVQLEREKYQKLEQEMLTKSSQVKQYAKETERLKQQLSTLQAVENGSTRAHSLSDKSESVAGLAKLTEMFRTANEQLSSKNSKLRDEVKGLQRINTQLEERLSSLSRQIQEDEHGLLIQNGVHPEIIPQAVLLNQNGNQGWTTSHAQEATSFISEQALSIPPQIAPHTLHASLSQSPPRQPVACLSQVDDGSDVTNVENSTALFENSLQREVDDEIHHQAANVIQEVSGGRRDMKTDLQRPLDPNLVCPVCRKKFRIGEIQKFKKHVDNCTGTDGD